MKTWPTIREKPTQPLSGKKVEKIAPMPAAPFTFDVFLSYNTEDKEHVIEVAEALRARGLRPWLDVWELIPGRRWQEALEEVL